MKKHGFTLIELLASLAIISVLMLAGFMIFGSSLKISKESYDNELDFKQTSYAMLYIENIIRSSYKIEPVEATSETNFIAYVKNPNDSVSTYKFRTGSYNKSTYLMADSTNLTKGLSDGGVAYIARCESLYLFFDEATNTIKIRINENTPSKLENTMYLGEKL